MVFQLSGVSVAVACLVASAAVAEQVSPEMERNLDKFALAYEDLAAALDGVEDMVDADLVASRVAADFLLLRELSPALNDVKANEVSPELARSFTTRCAEAGKTAKAAMERLQGRSCYESEALPAALSLAPLLDVPLQKSPALATAAMELVVNNKEMIILMLDEAVDEQTAPQVAALVQAALVYGNALAAFSDELGEELLEVEQKRDFGKRVENFNIDFAEHKARLSEAAYFGCPELRALFERGEVSEP